MSQVLMLTVPLNLKAEHHYLHTLLLISRFFSLQELTYTSYYLRELVAYSYLKEIYLT